MIPTEIHIPLSKVDKLIMYSGISLLCFCILVLFCGVIYGIISFYNLYKHSISYNNYYKFMYYGGCLFILITIINTHIIHIMATGTRIDFINNIRILYIS